MKLGYSAKEALEPVAALLEAKMGGRNETAQGQGALKDMKLVEKAEILLKEYFKNK